MYEEIVKFIRDKNRFSPTILYDILRSEYMIDYYVEARDYFTIDEWIDIMLGAIDYNPKGYVTKKQK